MEKFISQASFKKIRTMHNNINEDIEQQNKDIEFILELTDRLKKQRQISVDENWKELYSRINREKYRDRFFTIVRRAAAILILPALALSGYMYYELDNLKKQPIEQIELQTAYGVVSRVVLSDGTEVMLNSGSKLTYPERFVGGKRQVYLSGEAYFKVESDPDNRFEVLTSEGVTVSAYGTEFNVKSYDDDDEIEATLTRGKVEVEYSGSDINQDLNPGEQAVFNKDMKNIKLHTVNLLTETSWKDGKIIFRRTPMEDVAKKLSRHFNVDIILKGEKVYDYAYSATFTTETLSEILSLLEKTAPIKCEIVEPKLEKDFLFSKKRVLISSI